MHITQHIITVGNGIHNHTHSADIINFMNRLVLCIHFTVNGIYMLNPCRNGMLNIPFHQLCADTLFDPHKELFLLFTLLLQAVDNLIIADGIQTFQRKVFKLPFDALHPQAVRDWRINLHGFQCLVPLFFLREELEGTRIVQPVRQLDQDHADILRHRHKHFAKVLFLGVLQHPQPGNAIHQLSNRCAEFVLNFLIAEFGILNAVMQQPGTNRVGIQPHFYNNLCYRYRMDDIRLTIPAFLSLVSYEYLQVGFAPAPVQSKKQFYPASFPLPTRRRPAYRMDAAYFPAAPAGSWASPFGSRSPGRPILRYQPFPHGA